MVLRLDLEPCFVVTQEFLRNNAPSKNPQGPKTRSQGPRSRRRTSRAKPPRKSQTTAKARRQPANATDKSVFIPTTHGFGQFSAKTEPSSHKQHAVNSPQMVPRRMSGTSAGDIRTLTYAERMNDYIAQALTEDNENDRCQSPPTPSQVHSHSLTTTSSEPRYFSRYSITLENVSERHSGGSPSVRHTVPRVDAVTPYKTEVEIGDSSPVAKRRLFPSDASRVGSEAHLEDGRINAETVVSQLGHQNGQNGYRALQKFFTSSLNGKSLGPVDHYEDGLLAIANAACLMSTGVSDGHWSHTKVSEDQGWC